MAKVVRDGYRVVGQAAGVHTGAGRLVGYLISHDESTPQTVIFYDSMAVGGTVLHVVNVSPERSPFFVRFGQAPGSEEGIPFSTGLSVNAGNCEVAIWSFGF
jgi:hypothetical protein